MKNKRFVKYYIWGYLNVYFTDYVFSYDSTKGTYQQFRLRSALKYLRLSPKIDLSHAIPLFTFCEGIVSSVFVSFKALLVFFRRLFVKRKEYCGQFFLPGLSVSSFRVRNMLNSTDIPPASTMRIPFISASFMDNEVDILTALSYLDIFGSLYLSWNTIWTLYRKYRHRDALFRSYASFEYYLTCFFVKNNEARNKFVYYNNYDRWAFLFSNTQGSLYIQHGKLLENLHLIRVGTPTIAYFLNKRQERILQKMLFETMPDTIKYRKNLTFTYDDVLLHNGKKNVLIVCWSNKINIEWKICELLFGLYNIYLKPHPGDKNNQEYIKMAERYSCAIIPKSGYPKVDAVISYDSTLADEYEDVGIKVIRYDILDDLQEIIGLI